MVKEEWRPVVGYEGMYEVSNFGRVWSIRRKLFLKPVDKPYLRVRLYSIDGTNKMFSVHRLVAEAFIPNPDNLPCINHKDENKMNNCIDNLEWCTAKYNSNYGTAKQRWGEKQKGKKIPPEQIAKRVAKIRGRYNTPTSKSILQYTKNGDFIKEWPSSQEIERVLGFGSSNIRANCRGESKTSYGYIWKHKEPQAS